MRNFPEAHKACSFTPHEVRRASSDSPSLEPSLEKVAILSDGGASESSYFELISHLMHGMIVDLLISDIDHRPGGSRLYESGDWSFAKRSNGERAKQGCHGMARHLRPGEPQVSGLSGGK